MPVTPTYPGVYIEEVPSGVRTITGVATAITAFIGRAVRGKVDEPVRIQSYGDYDRAFGGLSLDSPMSYSVQHFFQNGGTDAIIVRVYRAPDPGGASVDGVAHVTLNPHPGYAAQGTLTIATQPSDGDTMTIGAKTYTFQETLTDVDGQIHIGDDVATTRANIIGAINLTGTAGTSYASSTTVHPTVAAANAFVGDALVLTAKAPGPTGNNIATTSNFTSGNNRFDAVTLGATREGTRGASAQGTLTMPINPTDGDTMTIGTKTYTFEGAAAQGMLTLAVNPTSGDTMIIDTKRYRFESATAAQGTLAITDNPSDGETMTIGTKVYTFQAALTDVDGNIQIGADVAATQANIVGAINLSGTAGTDYAASMTVHPTVAAGAFAGNSLDLTAKTAGAAGNTIALAQTFAAAGNVFDAPTLGNTTAGAEVDDVDGHIHIGTDLAATQANTVAAINRTGTPGTGYAASMTVHPTVTAGAFAGNNLVLTAKTAGAAGNAIALAGTFTAAGNVFDAPTLGNTTAGADADDVDGHIQIGPNVAATQANIVAAINRTGAPGTDFVPSMTVHPTVTADRAFLGNALILTARTPGAAGNAIVLAETFTAAANEFNGAMLGNTSTGTDGGSIILEAANPGEWGNHLRVTADVDIRDRSDTTAFNLRIEERDPSLPQTAPPIRSEEFRNVSVDPASHLFVDKVLESRSTLVRVRTGSSFIPDAATADFAGGSDGQAITDSQISAPGLENRKEGLWALEKADLFNILCIPPLTLTEDIGSTTRDAALQYCKQRRAFYILDPPRTWTSVSDAESGVDELNLRDENVAVYFPRVKMVDPLRDNQLSTFVPCGVVAGVYARSDARRGIWKAPAGTEASMSGVRELDLPLTDGENGRLNPLGVNCLRRFPVVGNVVWGSRTVEGADQLASEWKYVPVRRTALFLEESLYRGLQWVVFEPNDEPLWAQIRLNVGSFMHTLFRRGAFQGASPKEAYLVKCDKETTIQADIDRGVVNILVGFAPLKPAEFVFVKIQQLAGQLQA